MREAVVHPALPVDLRQTLSPLGHGGRDPCIRHERGAFWYASRTPEGPGTARFSQESSGAVRVNAWGPGAEWLVAGAPELLGASDSLDGFEPRGPLKEIHAQNGGLRFGRSRAVYEALVPTVLEQLVTSTEAHGSFRRMVRAWSEEAPWPDDLASDAEGPLMLPLPPAALAQRAYFELAPFGVEMKRAGALRAVSQRAAAVDRLVAVPKAEARAALESLPGIGPWTSAHVAQVALGDADAVPVGDYHLPNLVSFAFTGEARGNDERMLELLAPYAGHRGRVLRLLFAAGIRAPRFGPRHRLRPRLR